MPVHDLRWSSPLSTVPPEALTHSSVVLNKGPDELTLAIILPPDDQYLDRDFSKNVSLIVTQTGDWQHLWCHVFWYILWLVSLFSFLCISAVDECYWPPFPRWQLIADTTWRSDRTYHTQNWFPHFSFDSLMWFHEYPFLQPEQHHRLQVWISFCARHPWIMADCTLSVHF